MRVYCRRCGIADELCVAGREHSDGHDEDGKRYPGQFRCHVKLYVLCTDQCDLTFLHRHQYLLRNEFVLERYVADIARTFEDGSIDPVIVIG